jgi:putative flippase GtrA
MKKTIKPLFGFIQPRSFSRFALVGVANTFIGVGAFPLLYWFFNPWCGVNILLVLSWIVTTVSAFLLHKLVTFQSAGRYRSEGAKFTVLSLVTLGANIGVMNLALHFTTLHPVTVQVGLSILVAVTLMIFSYFSMDKIIFKKKR